MRRRKTGLFLLGVTFFFCGAIAARLFHSVNLSFFQTTSWADVLTLSAIGIVGLALAFYAASGLRKPR